MGYLATGIDGLFTAQSDIGVLAREIAGCPRVEVPTAVLPPGAGALVGRSHDGPMVDFGALDAISYDSLRATGGLNWAGPDQLWGSFVAEMDFGIAPEIRAALHAAVDRDQFGYLPPGLSTDMSTACAEWLQRMYSWSVDPSDVRPAGDVIGGMQALLAHWVHPGSPVIVPTPAYRHFISDPAELGHPVIEVPMVAVDDRAGGWRWQVDLAGLEAAYEAGADLLILCTPQNPLGRVYDRAELLAVAEVVDRHGGHVFADEIHCSVVYPGSRHIPYASISEAAAQHSVTGLSASKAWNMAGLKCAQLITTNDAARTMWRDHAFATEMSASNLGLVAATAAYNEGGPWLEGVLGYLDRNRLWLADAVSQQLPGISYRVPEGTYLAWLDCTELGLGDSPATWFREHAGVILGDGSACGLAGAGCVRLNLATPLPVLRQLVRRLTDALGRR